MIPEKLTVAAGAGMLTPKVLPGLNKSAGRRRMQCGRKPQRKWTIRELASLVT